MLSPGRQSDLDALKRKYAQAKSIDHRNKWAWRIQQILKESESRRVTHLRYQLIAAYKANDSDLAADISHVIWKESMTEKLRRR